MKKYIVSISIGDNVQIAVNANDEEQAFNIAQDIVFDRYKILENNTSIGLGYVFLNEIIEETN
jgi:hypothetical protein